MRICYVDEAGSTGELVSADSPEQPVFVLAGVIIEHGRLAPLTREFIDLKRRFMPQATAGHWQDGILAEMKGADLRTDIRSGSRRRARRAVGVLDHVVRLLERHGVHLVGRLWVKGLGLPFVGKSVYTFSIQRICEDFQHHLAYVRDTGIVIADSRRKHENANVSHSVFTKKFRKDGDLFDRIVEMPTFGHSENHAGIQMADLLCSALLFPMATTAYCTGRVRNVHVAPEYAVLRTRFGDVLQRLQYRYRDANGKWCGGVTVCDALGKRPGGLLFR